MGKWIQNILVVALLLIPREVWVSGYQEKTGIADFVFVTTFVSLKIYRGSTQMLERTDLANRQRLAAGEERAIKLAEQIKHRLVEVAKTIDTAELEFVNIDEQYVFYEKSTSGYEKMPTYRDEDPWQKIWSNPYYLVNEHPRVVVRFKKWPRPTYRKIIKEAVTAVIATSEVNDY